MTLPALSSLSNVFADTAIRSSLEEVRTDAALVASVPLVRALLDGYPSAALLLNENRQIVTFNARAEEMFGRSPDTILGTRLGEALGCTHALAGPAGCGTAPHCAQCGGARSITLSRADSQSNVQECRLTIDDHGKERALDFRVHASPVSIEGRAFTLVGLEDIAAEKRRDALEHVFFHDVLNTAHVVNGVARLIGETADQEQLQKLQGMLTRSAAQLIEEIRAQRDLFLAERGELAPVFSVVAARRLLTAVREIYLASPLADGRQLVQEPGGDHIRVHTDSVQAVRCLGNLVKNALEATDQGGTVTLRARADRGSAVFEVVNAGTVPDAIQMQIFQRSFSSKAARGRGIGTYSVKLIVEQYLRGTVSFVSDEREGTVFRIRLPLVG